MKIKTKELVYKTSDGYFYKDQFMGYVFLPQTAVDIIDKSIDDILNINDYQEAISKNEPIEFTNKKALINIVLSLIKPFLFENHRGINERSIKIINKNNRSIDLGYPNPIFVSINDPSGETINIDPLGFFGYVKNCLSIVFAVNKTVHEVVFGGDFKNDNDKIDRFCSRLAVDITENIINVVFSVSESEDTFKQTFEVVCDNIFWNKGDWELFNGCVKIEFINFRNFNKDFYESKVCRFFSINNDRKYLLKGCSIKMYIRNIIYMSKIKDRTPKTE